jgi:hypothetical protein
VQFNGKKIQSCIKIVTADDTFNAAIEKKRSLHDFTNQCVLAYREYIEHMGRSCFLWNKDMGDATKEKKSL